MQAHDRQTDVTVPQRLSPGRAGAPGYSSGARSRAALPLLTSCLVRRCRPLPAPAGHASRNSFPASGSVVPGKLVRRVSGADATDAAVMIGGCRMCQRSCGPRRLLLPWHSADDGATAYARQHGPAASPRRTLDRRAHGMSDLARDGMRDYASDLGGGDNLASRTASRDAAGNLGVKVIAGFTGP